jgi:hypothetical protein
MPTIKVHPYRGLWAAIATMHDKECAIAPPLCRWFDMTVTTAPGVDTDALGTFTGDIARKGTMLDAARQKAQWAIARTGAPLGVGSEGAFGPDSFIPFVASGIEVLLMHEAASGHEIVVQRRTRTNFTHVVVSERDDLDEFLIRIGFPSHAVVVRPENPSDTKSIYKGLQDRGDVAEAVREVARRSATGRAMVQTDMRAHLNPTRMAAIGHVARLLALKAARCCPTCVCPGFGVVDVVRGIPCRDCATPTRLIKAEVYGCEACGHRVQRHVRSADLRSDPQWCDVCNP